MKYVSCGDQNPFTKDLKSIYSSINEEQALDNLVEFKEKWRSKYPSAIKS